MLAAETKKAERASDEARRMPRPPSLIGRLSLSHCKSDRSEFVIALISSRRRLSVIIITMIIMIMIMMMMMMIIIIKTIINIIIIIILTLIIKLFFVAHQHEACGLKISYNMVCRLRRSAVATKLRLGESVAEGDCIAYL